MSCRLQLFSAKQAIESYNDTTELELGDPARSVVVVVAAVAVAVAVAVVVVVVIIWEWKIQCDAVDQIYARLACLILIWEYN